MKKEWIYFIAGAGLIGVVIFSVGCSEAPTNCKDVALYANADPSVNKDDLTDREIQIALKLYEERPRLTSTTKKRGDHVEMYARCVAIEGAF
jgi:hypothetical protein